MVNAGFSAVNNLTNNDYQLGFDGANWSITNLGTGASSVLGPPGTYVHDGVQITIGAGGAAGDRFLLRPTRGGGQDIGVLITDLREIAAGQTGAVGDNQNALGLAALQTQ